jgi:hypothetical protein
MGDLEEMEDIGVNEVRVACHQLVVLDETADAFDFGHFSVAEFFQADQRTNKYHETISQDFGANGIWRLVSAMCVSQMQSVPGYQDTYPYPKGAKIFWGLFGRNIHASCQAPPLSRASQSGPVQAHSTNVDDKDQPARPPKICIIGAVVDISDTDEWASTYLHSGVSFVAAKDGCIPLYYILRERGWSCADAAIAVCGGEPSSKNYIANSK